MEAGGNGTLHAMKDLSGRIAALTPEQRAMFEALRKSSQPKKAAPLGPPPGAIPRRAEGGPAPLSFDQERLWFLHQLDPGETAYNITTVTRLRGALDVACLAAALQEIVRRHEAWRTVLPAVDGRPVQVVLPRLDVPLPVIDLAAVADAGSRALALARQEARRPFDFERGPLVRARLFRVAPEEHLCVLVVHHIVTDWVSFQLAWHELAALYLAFQERKPSPLPPPPIQYADFAVWQRSWMDGEALQRYLDFWLQEIAGAPQALELPTDRPRPAFLSMRGGMARLRVAAADVEALRAVGRKEGATTFMALLAIWGALLERLTGAGKVLISSPNANRGRTETQGLLGFLLTQLVFATDVTGDPTFRELLVRARGTALRAFSHQDLPFGKLVEAVRPERDPSRAPLVQVNLLVLDTDTTSFEMPGLTLENVRLEEDVARFDLGLAVLESAEGFGGFLEFNRDLFDRTTAERLAAAFARVVLQVGRDAEVRVSALDLLGEAARQQVLYEWNDTEVAEPAAPVHELVAAVAARTPGATALLTADGEMTYGELDRLASHLAAGLVERGIGRGARVGLCLERTADLAVAMLGVWKAGAAWVPLDPAYPADRLAFIQEDAGLALVLGGGAPLPGGGSAGGRGDGGEGLWVGESPASDDLAYVIYTSGTTGRPKGVLVEHGSLARVLAASRQTFGWNAADRIPVLAPFSFDIFLFELWSPLTAGGTAELIPLAPALDLPRLMAGLERATRLHAVPALMRQIVALGRAEGRRWPGVRTLFVGGDAVPPELLAELPEVFPAASIRILYGPTEGTIICASLAADGLPWKDHGPKNLLGRPLPGAVLRVVDRSGARAALGVPGELWIGGAGVTRGYLGQAELTAARYVESDGRRWYRTGDLARWLPDGLLEFLGRVDAQVKIRGFRIEPGEIETALLEQPAVREAVVLAAEVPGGDKRLVAYVVPEAAAEWPAAEPAVRGALARRLPEHMVPAVFVALAALPLTAHGKVDRRALLRQGADLATRPADATAPRTPAEEVLAAIWRELLGVETVGVHDNFFRLGGDSILGIQVVARARRAGLVLTPRQIFEQQTVAALAEVARPVEEAAGSAEEHAVGEVPLTPVQRRFLAEEPADPHWFNQALLLDLRRPVAPGPLERALALLAERHDALRWTLKEDRAFLQSAAAVPFLVVDLAAVPESAFSPAVEAASAQLQTAFDLQQGPVFLSAMFLRPPSPACGRGAGGEGAGGERRLFLAAHHLVVDAVSWRILLEDLQLACEALATGAPLDLPPRTSSWKRWAERLAAQAASPAVRRELGHWLLLEASSGLPVDLPGTVAEDTVGAAGTVTVELPAAATAALLREAPVPYHARVEDLLLTALAQAFAAWTGAPRRVVELEGHGREEIGGGIDVSRTVGWFTSVFPVALDLTGTDGPREAIQAVKEQRRAVPGQGLGYGLLRYGGGGSALAAQPEAVVGFNYLGQLDAALPAGGAFAVAPESAGPVQSPRARRRHRIDVDALVWEGRLKIHLTYAARLFSRAAMERLAEGIVAALEALLAHCLAPGAGGWTPSDVPLARLDAATLDRLVGDDPAAVEDLYPLTPLQSGMLFHTLYTPGSEIYFEQLTATLAGPLDAAALERAWQAVTDRQPVLRTAFVWEGLARPLQIVRRGVAVPWSCVDWRGEADPAARFAVAVAADREAGFDLARAPLLRLFVARTGEAEHRLLWSFHHLLFDGWCFSLLFREVFAVYEAARRGTVAELPPVRPYRDYLAWLERQDPVASEMFWRTRLAGVEAPTPVPLDAPEAPAGRVVADFREVERRLDPAVATALAAFARAEGLTLNTCVQGAWAVLLERWSGRRDVLFGAVVAGRPADLPGVESIVGLFINTLPVRAAVEAEAPVADWLRRLQTEQVAQRAHEAVPLADVQRWSGAAAGGPLFDSLIVFENYPVDPSLGGLLGDLEIRDVRVAERSNYALTLAVVVREDFVLRLGFDDRLTAETADLILAQLAAVLAAFAAAPRRTLGALPEPAGLAVLRERAARNLTRTPAAEAATGRPPRNAVEEALVRVWRSVLRLERVGVEDDFFRLGGDSILSLQIVARARQEGLALTPREIFEHPTIAALAVVARPVGAEEEGEEEGAGEVPLTPIQRFFLAQAAPEPHWFNQSVLLTAVRPVDPAHLGRALALLPARHDALRWTLEGEAGRVRPSVPWPMLQIDLSALPATAFAAAVEAACARLQAGFDLQHGPVFLSALFSRGGEQRLLLAAHHLVVDAVSWRILLEDLDTAVGQLEAGEAVHLPARTTSWRRWAERLAVHARSEAVRGELEFWRQGATPPPLPVDRPEGANTIDAASTVSVELSAEATEDLVRRAPAAWRTRVDELLLAALARTVARWTGGARVRLDLEGHGRAEIAPGIDLSRTVGWFTAVYPVTLDLTGAETAPAAIRAVKEQLRAVPGDGLGWGLLRWMRASAASALAALPAPEISFNYLGRLDGALGASGRWEPAAEAAGLPQSPRAPRGHLLEVNALVFGGRLRVDWGFAGRHDRATVEALAARFREDLEEVLAACLAPGAGGWTPSDVPLARLDQAALDALLAGVPDAADAADIEDIYPVAPLQGGMIFHTLYAPGSEIYFEQMTGTLAGPLDPDAFVQAWQVVAARQPVLRTAFAWEGLERPLQIVHRAVQIPWILEDWRGETGVAARLDALAAADRARGFDLATAPLLRFTLVRTGPAEHRLLWSFHHLLFDGWCFSLLLREVLVAYEALRRGEPVELEPVRPYRDYIAWLARQDAARAEAFWRNRLADVTAATPLPFDHPEERGGRAAADFHRAERHLPAPLAASLARLAQDAGLTLSTVVQGAWALLLARWSGAHDVVFGAVVSGRPAELPGIESMIGLFINTLPVRVEIDPGMPVLPWLRRLQEEHLAQRELEWSPLADVQRWSGVAPGAPLFDSLVVFENYPVDPDLGEQLGELRFRGGAVSERTNYPLTLGAMAQDGFHLTLSHDRRIEPATAELVLDQLEAVLAACAADLARPLGALPALPGEEEMRGRVRPADRRVAGETATEPGLPQRPRNPVEDTLAQIWCAVLRREPIGIHEDFFHLGGDSILSLQIVARARQAGLVLTPRQIFENPTIAGLAALAEPAASAAPGVALPPIEIDPAVRAALCGADPAIEDLYPLAPLQKAMFLHGLAAPDSPFYLEQLACRLEGELDAAAFRGAWRGLLDRHPALRTAFAWQGLAAPLQVVRGGVALPWTEEDWRALPAAEQEARWRRRMAEDAGQVFDLGRPPLQRVLIVRTGEREHRLLWSFHHLLFDGWCFGLLFRDLFLLYDALRRGEVPQLGAVPPYRDFIAWLAGRPTEGVEAWWRRRLAGFAAATPLPLDHPEPAEPGERTRHLSAAGTAAVEAFARARRLTPSTLFQGAWALLLSRYGGGRDVLCGSVVSGRPPELPGVESMIGLFINTLPLRLDVDPEAPAAAWLQGVQEAHLDLRPFEHVPVTEVQGWSELPPGEPLFHSLTVFEKFPYQESVAHAARGLEVRDLVMRDRTDVPLSAVAVPAGEALALMIAHDGQTAPATAERLLRHLEALLTGLAADPERPLGDVPLLAADERSQLLAWGKEGWTPPASTLEEDLPVHALFLRRAAESPEAPALLDMDGRVTTYGELAARATRRAAALRERGVGPEVPVAIRMERSPRMIEAVLAVLLAGGAYVPIDPETPEERVGVILEDSGALVVDWESEEKDQKDNQDNNDSGLSSLLSLESLAYVLYTSGSTGTPKGVLVSHRSLAAYTRAVCALYGIGPADRAIQFASLSFDASAEEIFSALAVGASLVVRSGPLEDVATFLRRATERGLTLLSLPTAYWHVLAAALAAGEVDWPAGVRLVTIGGERALPGRWADWGRGVESRARLFNAYGPTEATIAATVHEHPGTPGPAPREVPIGRPLPGWNAHVLGAGLRLPPAGAVGELYLGGVGLARGYLGDPARTAERFVPDPFGAAGERLYCTGDLARRRPDGLLEFAGRIDRQVKVRGFRVELGEVEAALAACPAVREAAAVTRPDASGNARLSACVVWREAADVAGLRTLLERRLPAWMIPSEVFALDALPVTAAGKLDRRALERALPAAGGTGREIRPPGNEVEERLAAIWSELLGVEPVGLDDDFFLLGGQSLLATQLVSRVRQVFGVELPLHDLFTLRTLEAVARKVLDLTLGESEALDSLMDQLDGLSEEEVQALLAAEEGDGAP